MSRRVRSSIKPSIWRIADCGGVILLGLCLLVGIQPKVLAQASGYTVTLVTGGTDVMAKHINNQGQVCGFYWSNNSWVPWVWTGSTGITELPSATGGFAWSINDDGYVAGGTWTDNLAVRWRLGDSSYLALGSGGIGLDVNSSGQVVTQAGLYSDLNGITPYAGGFDVANGGAVNDTGVVAGLAGVSNTPPYYQLAIWTGGSTATPLGNCPNTGGPEIAEAINNAGQIVGFSPVNYGNYPPSAAFYYSPGQRIANIGSGSANGINNQGEVVGGRVPPYIYFSYGDYDNAWYWTPKAGRINLNTLIPANSGWYLLGAFGINDLGQIVGIGYYPYNPANPGASPVCGFMLTPNFYLFTLSVPAKVTGSLKATGKVTLNQAAPYSLIVSLTNTNPAATVPTTVTIAAGKFSASFPITTSAVAAKQTGSISASYYGVTVNKTLTVEPVGIKSMTLSSASMQGGSSAGGTISLQAPAAPGDITVSFSTNNPAVVPTPASIIIPAGSQTGSFTVNTNTVTANTLVKITAKANGTSKSVSLTVTP